MAGFFVIKAAINNEIYTIANIYGPNKDAEAVKFYRNLSKLLRNDEFGNEESIIIGGDYNCPLDITLDKKGGLPIPRKYIINSIDELFTRHLAPKTPNIAKLYLGALFTFCILPTRLLANI